MSDASEIGSAVVTLGADMSPLRTQVQGLKGEMEKQTNELGFIMNPARWLKLKIGESLFDALLAPLEAVKHLMEGIAGPVMKQFEAGLTSWEHWIEVAIDAEAHQTRFNLLLAKTGATIGWNAEQMKIMQEGLMAKGFGHESALQAQDKLMMFPEVRGEQFRDALEIAADLSALLGQDLPHAAQVLGMALENPIQGMQRLRREKILFTDQEKEDVKQAQMGGGTLAAQEKLLELLHRRVPEAAEAMANTTQGRLNKVHNAWHEFGLQIGDALKPATDSLARYALVGVEVFGGVFGPLVERAGQGIKGFAESANEFISRNGETFQYWGSLVGDVVGNTIDWLQSKLGELMPSLHFDINSSGWQAFGDGITKALETLDRYSSNLDQYWRDFGVAAKDVWSTLKTGVIDWVSSMKPPLMELFDSLASRLGIRIRMALVEATPDAFYYGADKAGQKEWELKYLQQLMTNLESKERYDAALKAKTARDSGLTGAPEKDDLSDLAAALAGPMGLAQQEAKQMTMQMKAAGKSGALGAPNPDLFYSDKPGKGGFEGFEKAWDNLAQSLVGGGSMTDLTKQVVDNTATANGALARVADSNDRIAAVIEDAMSRPAAFAA